MYSSNFLPTQLTCAEFNRSGEDGNKQDGFSERDGEESNPGTMNSNMETHALPSAYQKKKDAKKAREAKRKAKKIAVASQSGNTLTEDGLHQEGQEGANAGSHGNSNTLPDLMPEDSLEPRCLPTQDNQPTREDKTNIKAQPATFTLEAMNGLNSASPPKASKPAKHSDWTRFEHDLAIDRLTHPCLPTGCPRDTTCAFEAAGILDCPFHEPCE